MDMFITPIVIFLIFVAPLWLILHYRSKKQISQGLTDSESKALTQLIQQTETMTQRISVLESILDDEQPEWRDKHELK